MSVTSRTSPPSPHPTAPALNGCSCGSGCGCGCQSGGPCSCGGGCGS